MIRVTQRHGCQGGPPVEFVQKLLLFIAILLAAMFILSVSRPT